MLCSFALFVSSFGFIGPEKPHWGVVNRYIILDILFGKEQAVASY